MKHPAAIDRAGQRMLHALGGAARARVVLVLGAVLGLDGAGKGTVSAMAGPIKEAFHVGNTGIGLLASVVSLVSAVFTIPVGVLTDRVTRTRLLALSTSLWVAATVLSAVSPPYTWLLVSRTALGAVTATAGPTVASLVGDSFPVGERARMYGPVLAGELVGTGVGFAISGTVGSALGRRFAFWWLIVPGVLLVWAVVRLPEPARGGQGRLRPGQDGVPEARGRDAAGERAPATDGDGDDRGAEDARTPATERNPAARAVEAVGVPPHEDLILHGDPRTLPLGRAVRYVLRVRTNVVLIAASAHGAGRPSHSATSCTYVSFLSGRGSRGSEKPSGTPGGARSPSGWSRLPRRSSASRTDPRPGRRGAGGGRGGPRRAPGLRGLQSGQRGGRRGPGPVRGRVAGGSRP
ncbi:hypothetical protein C1I97_26345 [Streptomyces sp. NTH33]|uniref:MFS transporter n=1 Tax=Streptomyces sp. NTH33 TaxID=1735453 RepID=UPI000DA78D6F|nr:MFS transporter [Streptomyces sp. NTH33]PZG96284.1 hypothetical protein C1I97_26345 [Streptomyces sp. NTH33]